MAGYVTAGLNAMVNGVAAAGAYISAHTADPGSGGASEVTYAGAGTRQQTTWAVASGGSRTGSQVALAIPASTTVTHWGVWSAATGGTFLAGFPLGAAEAFGAAGALNHTPTLAATN